MTLQIRHTLFLCVWWAGSCIRKGTAPRTVSLSTIVGARWVLPTTHLSIIGLVPLPSGTSVSFLNSLIISGDSNYHVGCTQPLWNLLYIKNWRRTGATPGLVPCPLGCSLPQSPAPDSQCPRWRWESLSPLALWNVIHFPLVFNTSSEFLRQIFHSSEGCLFSTNKTFILVCLIAPALLSPFYFFVFGSEVYEPSVPLKQFA